MKWFLFVLFKVGRINLYGCYYAPNGTNVQLFFYFANIFLLSLTHGS